LYVSTAMEIYLLGRLQVVDDGHEVALPPGQPRALLTLLALHPGEALATDRIVDALWSGSPPPSAPGVVQTYVSRLRKLLGDASIRTIGRGYALELNGGMRDIDEVTRLRQRARGEPPEDAVTTLRDALALFRGRPLQDVADHEFAQAELRRLDELRTAILSERLDLQLSLGRHAEVLPELESLVEADPLDEAMRARLMLALYRCGRQAEALETYREGHAELDQLGLEPGGPLRSLQRAILGHDPSLAPPATGHPPAPGDTDEPTPTAPLVRRRTAKLVAVLGGVLVVLAGAAIVLALRDDGPAELTVPKNSVAVIDPATDRVVAAIPVGVRPAWVTAGAGAVWVTNTEDQTVSRIDPESLAVTASIGLGFEPSDIVAVGDHIWVVGGYDHVLWRIDADGLPRRKLTFEEQFLPLPAGYEKGPATLATDGESLWLAHGKEVTRLDGVTGEVRGTIEAGGMWAAPVGMGTRGYVFDRFETGGKLASEYDQFVQLFDPKRLVRTGRIATSTYVSDILVAGGSAWIALPTADAIWEVDDSRGILVRTFPAGDNPMQVAFADDALWVTNMAEGVVRRIHPRSGEVEEVIDIGHTPIGIAVTDGRLFVTVSEP
jgi:YVTN family beta-propeller protein